MDVRLHPHRDLEQARHIRNALDQRGHNPLPFFRKCLEDDGARLPELIREEGRIDGFSDTMLDFRP